MKDSTTVEWLSKAIGQATKSAKFCVVGNLPVADPGIEVEGVGAISLPLNRAMAKRLVASCQVAPYGKGTQTLVNKKIRNTLELDPKKFSLSEEWNSAIVNATKVATAQLGLPADQLEARLYKLLVYEKGGFFLPHRDSEKHDRMVASMVVVLANPFEGGKLVVRHGAVEQTITFEDAASGNAPCYAAFYADCEHEVHRVTAGVRLCLAYNLMLKATRGKPSVAVKPAAPADVLADSIRSWIARRPGDPLVFALEHHYTQRGLALDLLKGADRKVADQVVAAAERTDCVLHLAQVSRHLLQFADDGSLGRAYSRHYRAPRRAIEIGETYEDDFSGSEWTDIRGKKQPWGDIAFDLSAIVSSVPIDDWKPTTEDFEGYTGNAGNSLDRWYHRSAIVVWSRDHHFDVVARSGASASIPLLCSMAAKLSKIPKKRLEEARIDCIRFARAIIAKWPARTSGYWRTATREKSEFDAFPEQLLTLHDRDTIAMFLTKLAERDQSMRLSSFIVSACREFGWSAFAQQLRQLISSRPSKHGSQEIPFRDIDWLSAFCCDKSSGPDKSALAGELCTLAIERFCEPRSPRPWYFPRGERREVTIAETSLQFLLKALVATGHDDGLSNVIDFVQRSPDEFSMDDCQVPCLKSLIPWSQKRLGLVHPRLVSWLASVRHKLESATAKHPVRPADWTRPAKKTCSCQYCAQLVAFLADPAKEVGRIAAREEARQHLISIIDQQECDVNYALERKGSPFSLVLTKTNGSFERAVKRFEADRRLLSALPVAE